MREKNKAFQMIAAGTIAVLMICVFLFMPLRSTAPLSIYRACETNDPTAGLISIFIVSNTSAFDLRLWPLPPQIKSPSGWRTTAPFGAVLMTYLPAHSVYTYTVPTMPNHATLRAFVGWDYERLYTVEFARRFFINNIRMNISRLSQGESPAFHGGNQAQVQAAFSPEFKD
jgi:hypothetical protein